MGNETIRLAHEKLAAPGPIDVTPTEVTGKAPGGSTVKVPLSKLCLARSGDKGDTCNVGLLARSPEVYLWAREHVTPAFVKERFASVCQGEVERFEVPNLLAMNFLLHHSLGGGGTLSLLLDAQGKTYAQYLLAAEVEVPQGLVPA